MTETQVGERANRLIPDHSRMIENFLKLILLLPDPSFAAR